MKYWIIAQIWIIGLLHGYSIPVIFYLIRQSALETNYWRSQSCLIGKNLFGMKVPSWSTYVNGEYLGHASYPYFYQSILDRLKWDKRNNISRTSSPGEYIRRVQSKGYAEATNYVATIENMFSVDRTSRNVGLAIPGIFFLIWLFR
jgi:flagellum-specific peptidoglycan hydrolase FlgJ